MGLLTRPHERALTLLYTELGRTAGECSEALIGTPGTLTTRRNAEGTAFWVRRYSDACGKRREAYVGKADAPETDEKLEALRERIEITNSMISSIRLLTRAGFAAVDKKAYAALTSLHNHGLFDAGACLIGSHAYGALLNSLGIRASPYVTEDVDVARGGELAVPERPSFLEMLRASGVELFEVPQLDRRKPSTSFRERSASRFRVDLLVPSRDETYPVVAVPELKAHATGLPYLSFLLVDSQRLPVLSSHGAISVRVPVPERYAVHKLIVAALRPCSGDQPVRDLEQAAVLLETLAEQHPGAIEAALGEVPRAARKHIAKSVRALARHLPAEAEAAWEAMAALSCRRGVRERSHSSPDA